MLPACCVGLKRSWPEVAVTGDGWNVCKTFPPGERRSGAGPVEQGETEESRAEVERKQSAGQRVEQRTETTKY